MPVVWVTGISAVVFCGSMFTCKLTERQRQSLLLRRAWGKRLYTPLGLSLLGSCTARGIDAVNHGRVHSDFTSHDALDQFSRVSTPVAVEAETKRPEMSSFLASGAGSAVMTAVRWMATI